MKRPACIFGIEILVILLFAAYLPRVAFWLPAAVSLLLGSVLVFCKQKQQGICMVLAAAASFLIGLHTVVFLEFPPAQYFGEAVQIHGYIVQIDSSYADEMTSAIIQVDQINSEPANFKIICERMPTCEIGEILQGWYTLHPVPDSRYQKQTYAKGIFCNAEYMGGLEIKGQRTSVAQRFVQIRTEISKRMSRYLDRDTGGVLNAMTIGDKDALSPYMYNAYKAAGIPHILVVSGLHMAILCSFIKLDQSSWRSRLRYGLVTGTIALLLMGLVGNTPSVVRAGISCILHGVGVIAGFPTDPLTSLALSGVLLCIGNRYVVCSIAFQLSFAATAGVLMGAALLRQLPNNNHCKQSKLLCAVREQVITSLMAALFVLPVQALQGLSISTISVLSNLVCFLFLRPMLFCGLIAALVCLIPPLDFILHGACFVGGLFAKTLNEVVLFFAEIPGAQFNPETYFATATAIIVVSAVIFCWYKGYCAQSILGLAVLLTGIAVGIGNYSSHNLIQITMLGNITSPAVVATQNKQAIVLFRGGTYAEKEIQTYLQSRNIQKIKMVVDMRLHPQRECAIQGEENIALTETADYMPKFHFLTEDIAIIMTMDLEGGVVALCCGDKAIWVPSGTIGETVGADHMEFLIASSANPGNLRNCEIILSLSKNFEWLKTHQKQNVYYGNRGASIWIRPCKNRNQWPTRITGAKL